ncbi:MAG: O-methyltransferase [Chitinophagaceae bacterium]
MDFIDSKIVDYSEQHTQSESELLAELNRYTHTSVLKPRMLSGHLQGRFLSFISHLIQPSFVLDIGTYTGYSALCLAEGLTKDGKLYTLDNNEEVLYTAAGFIKRSVYREQIEMLTGDALESIMLLNQRVPHWDLIWMDAEKSQYSGYYNQLIDKVRPGGIIMADNVLWSGKIIDQKSLEKDEDTRMLDAFNKQVYHDSRVESLLMPIRDGIMMLRKL